MLICDAHADTLYALAQNAHADCDVSAARMLADGYTRVQCLALWTGVSGLRGADAGLIERELDALERLLANGFRLIRDVNDAQPDRVNALLTIEGGEAFEPGLHTVDAYADKGVRIAGLVWNNDNPFAYSAVGGGKSGLTDAGKRLLRRLNERRVAPDVSHLNDAGFEDLLALSDVPPIATHSCCRALCDMPRNLTDDQLKRLFRAGGFVGVNFYPSFLSLDGHATIDDVCDHIDRMLQLGGEGLVGLGSDFDGIETHPVGLEHAGCVPALLDRLRERGYPEPIVADIAGESFRRYMERISA